MLSHLRRVQTIQPIEAYRRRLDAWSPGGKWRMELVGEASMEKAGAKGDGGTGQHGAGGKRQ